MIREATTVFPVKRYAQPEEASCTANRAIQGRAGSERSRAPEGLFLVLVAPAVNAKKHNKAAANFVSPRRVMHTL